MPTTEDEVHDLQAEPFVLLGVMIATAIAVRRRQRERSSFIDEFEINPQLSTLHDAQ